MVKISDVPLKHSIDSLSTLHRRLEQDQQVTSKNKHEIIEIIRSISEALIWSEQNHLNLFDYFSTSNLLNIFSNILLQQPDRQVVIQLLQSLTLLIHNLSTSDHKSFLIQSDFFSELIFQPFDFTDEEIVVNYTSLLKGLSVNISEAQLLEVTLGRKFTIFMGAMMFFNYPDNLVKTASRTVVLRILKCKVYAVDNKAVEEFILDSGFFFNLANSIRENISNLARAKNSSFSKLEEIVFDAIDTLHFVNDICSHGNLEYNAKIDLMMRGVLVFPVIAGSIVAIKYCSHHVPIPIAIFVASQIMCIVKHRELTNFIANLMFSDVIPECYIKCMQDPISNSELVKSPSEKLVSNPIKTNVVQFLKCRDDNLVALSLHLILNALENADQKELVELGLLPGQHSQSYIEWVGLVGETLTADFRFRFFTSFLALRLLRALHQASFALSNKITLQIVKNVLKKYTEIVYDISMNKPASETFIEVFKNEWEFVRELNWDEKHTIPLHFIFPALDEMKLNVKFENRISVKESEFVVYDLRMFLVVRKLFYLVFDRSRIDFEKFPVDTAGNEFDMKMKYRLNDRIFMGKPKINVQVKDNIGTFPRVLVKDDLFFFLLAPDEDDPQMYYLSCATEFGKIKLPRNSDPKILHVIVDGKNSLEVKFEDTMEWLTIKNSFEKAVKYLRNAELNTIQNFVNEHNFIIDNQ